MLDALLINARTKGNTMIRAAILFVAITAAALIARPDSAQGQTVPPQTIPPLCRCEENVMPEPELLPKHYLPFISR
jgi:hypothetical protein